MIKVKLFFILLLVVNLYAGLKISKPKGEYLEKTSSSIEDNNDLKAGLLANNQRDMYLQKLAPYVKSDDYSNTGHLFEKIDSLIKNHNVKIPNKYYFFKSKYLFKKERYEEAKKTIEYYLSSISQNDKMNAKALSLYNSIDLNFRKQVALSKKRFSVLISTDVNTEDSKLTKKISDLLRHNLAVSGVFNIIEENFSSDYDNFPDRILNNYETDINIILKITQSTDDDIILSIKVHDKSKNEVVLNKSYTSSKKSRYPFLAHNLAIDINDFFDGPDISWMNQLIIFSKYINKSESQILISDYTTTYQKVIVNGGLNIFPKWADKSKNEFYYTTYKFGKPTLMKLNLYTGKKSKIISSENMMVCSDVSKNGEKLILAMAPKGQPDIYIYDTIKKTKTRVTKYSGIDIGGSFVENNSKIVFVSDRLKYPNIFSKKLNSKGIERLVYHGKNNSQCATYENYIIYSSKESNSKDTFNLYFTSTTSEYVRKLTTFGKNLFPKFSKDGESVFFIKYHDAKSTLGIIRLHYDKSVLFPLKLDNLQSIDY